MPTTRKRPHLPAKEKGEAAEDTTQASAAPQTPYRWQQHVRQSYVDADLAQQNGVDPQTVKAVWVLLSTYINEKGQADPGQAALGRQIGGADDGKDYTRNVRRAIKTLREMGVLHVQRRGGIDPRYGEPFTALYTFQHSGQPRPMSDGERPDSETKRPDSRPLETGQQRGRDRTQLRPTNDSRERLSERLLETSAAARATADGKRGQVIAFPQSGDSRSSGSDLPAVPNPHKGTPDVATASGQPRPVSTAVIEAVRQADVTWRADLDDLRSQGVPDHDLATRLIEGLADLPSHVREAVEEAQAVA